MMWLFVWALVIASIQARPQYHQFDQSSPNVEFIVIPHGVIFPSWSGSNFEQLPLNPYIYLDDSFLPPETGEGSLRANNKPKTNEFVTSPIPQNKKETKLNELDNEINENVKANTNR
ncbi:hypothetical protein WA026_006830 [Henosepilachna vigintioctopunctata]|uniref:Uncharacterized protein n=1 Tax=Henosepilachna vigintioctopunctata TaxID=420089 RepID=A0AAW1UJ70_9CUCU